MQTIVAPVRRLPVQERQMPDEGLQRPLWLTEPEAEVLVSLCLVSLADAGAAEHCLFVQLGEYLRAFRP